MNNTIQFSWYEYVLVVVKAYLMAGHELVTDGTPHGVLMIDTVEAQMVIVDLDEAVGGGVVASYHNFCVFQQAPQQQQLKSWAENWYTWQPFKLSCYNF